MKQCENGAAVSFTFVQVMITNRDEKCGVPVTGGDEYF
jgi:hypothetical protein